LLVGRIVSVLLLAERRRIEWSRDGGLRCRWLLVFGGGSRASRSWFLSLILLFVCKHRKIAQRLNIRTLLVAALVSFFPFGALFDVCDGVGGA
jgi:hypothetical protein